MKFIHIADCHLDGYKDIRLGEIGFQNFAYTITQAIERNVDFFIIAGDLFNTALPRVDILKRTILELTKLKNNNIPVYIIPGSHDFSPNGKSMIDVLEAANLVKNVMQGEITEQNKLQLSFTIDKKTNTHITGIIGKKGMLDKSYYKELDTTLLHTTEKKIFLFHTAIAELRPESLANMEAQEVSFLPTGFDYYAGGHVHITKRYQDNRYKNVIYPGPTFPNNFSELEELQQGTFAYYDNTEQETVLIEKIPNREICAIHCNIEKTTPEKATNEIIEKIKQYTLSKKIVLLRIEGTITEGKTSDIDFKEIIKFCLDNGAYLVLKNTYKLVNDMFEEIEMDTLESEQIESTIIDEHLNAITFPNADEKKSIIELLEKLAIEQADGEKKTTFVERIISTSKHILEEEK